MRNDDVNIIPGNYSPDLLAVFVKPGTYSIDVPGKTYDRPSMRPCTNCTVFNLEPKQLDILPVCSNQ